MCVTSQSETQRVQSTNKGVNQRSEDNIFFFSLKIPLHFIVLFFNNLSVAYLLQDSIVYLSHLSGCGTNLILFLNLRVNNGTKNQPTANQPAAAVAVGILLLSVSDVA